MKSNGLISECASIVNDAYNSNLIIFFKNYESQSKQILLKFEGLFNLFLKFILKK